jgi:predicted nucleotidyltransferase
MGNASLCYELNAVFMRVFSDPTSEFAYSLNSELGDFTPSLNSSIMDPEIERILREWVLSKSFIVRLWVFGSRATGRHRPDSDLDIAIQIVGNGRENPYTMFFFDSELWRVDLQSRISLKVHLCHYDLGCDPELHESEGNILKSVQAGSVLIYDSMP